VNDCADELAVVLGTSTWKSTDDPSQEILRVKLFISYAANPISFSVLGLRPTKYSVWLKIAGYVLAIVTGFLTQYVQNKMHQ
jgi:hypothetical protein